MKSNELNRVYGTKDEVKALLKIGNRIKTLRLKNGHLNYEKFAFEHELGRMLLRRAERGQNIQLINLLKIIKALNVTLTEFFTENDC